MNLKSSFKLKQIVSFPTRGQNTLDLILTNLQDFYNVPDKRPPFGLSDHMTIELKPKTRSQLSKLRLTVKSRDLRPSSRLAMGTYLQQVNVPALLNTVDTCAEKVTLFESIVKTGLDLVLPLRSKTIHLNEPPWFNSALKDLIRTRQRALSQGNLPQFRLLRNRVNRERKICRARYYEAKVAHLKECKPSGWWKEVKKLSGMSPASGGRGDIIKSLQHIDGAPNASDLANVINDAFILPMREFSPLPADFQPERDTPTSPPFAVSAHSVFMKLASLNSTKAQGPDGVPIWLLKENADLLTKPITDILLQLLPGRQTTPIMEGGRYSSCPETKTSKRRQQTLTTNLPYTNLVQSCGGVCYTGICQAGHTEENRWKPIWVCSKVFDDASTD